MSDKEMQSRMDGLVAAALLADKGSQATLISWVSEIFTSKFDGTASNITNVRTKYSYNNQEHEVSYVVKRNPSRGAAFDDLYNIMFSKECGFYAEVIPALNGVLQEIGLSSLSFPKCLYYDMKKGHEIIFLENLRKQGYKMEDRTIGIGVAHTSLVLKELAKLHASCAILQAKNPDENLVERFDCLKKEWTQEFNLGSDFGGYVNSCLELGEEMFEKIGGCDKVISWIKKIRPLAWQMHDDVISKTPPFAVVTHGDCWINNMLFRYDEKNNPVEVKFFDMECCRKASLALDLQHLFNMNVPGPVRRPYLKTFLSTYYEAFTGVMLAAETPVPFTLDQLQEEYKNKGFYGALYAIMWLPNTVKRPEDMIDILDSKENSQNAERDNVLKMVDTNPFLKPRILSVVEEWEECGLIS